MREASTQMIDGKVTAAAVREELAEAVARIKQEGGKIPHLAAILVGHDGASETYVAGKVKACQKVGFNSTLIRLDDTVTEEALLAEVHKLNNDPDIDGFIVQLPLPKHINEQKVTEAILPSKDVDGFHPMNLGRLVLGLPCYVSATPNGIMQLIKRYGIETSGKHAVVIGRSHIVGRPMSILLSQNAAHGNCTVTLCHSRTQNLPELCRQADIIVAALGKPGFLTADMVKEGAVVIDVGITRVPDANSPKGYVIRGDVAFDEVAPKCAFISPVPGGVGPMTIASLLQNTLLAAQKLIYGR
ncbi:MAG: bifunctional methylenetetrahydrofolate dehydrogenase/methenyltetrahydrofolate cyclohydrolase FolD [Flavobacteriales bacterium]|nr:bifunctional methylenetetrahydrofolate dehydrogenase/methenyltetrahydrofolate cyclohydrolase FolD [Flavobacteriales bacterium]MCB9447927.1 bifunctional methylenetetrahydrofolate dehydrogenase/methenyltetrahydrofolate cyclohydrolase FolD [Flavobacteriales bacterium]